MNRYYQALFEPVRRRGGIISDVGRRHAGDLGHWALGSPPAEQSAWPRWRSLMPQSASIANRMMCGCPRVSGCIAASWCSARGRRRPLRVSGGGDIVNTASRIRRSTTSRTCILVSQEVLEGVDGFS
jgi:hypothetical protein